MKNAAPEKVCPATKMLALVGERHMLAVMYHLIAGPTGFTELKDRVGINTATLAKRLGQLEDERLIEKNSCPNDSRRHYYSLTKRGEKLSKLISEFAKV